MNPEKWPLDPAVAQWHLRDQACYAVIAMFFGGVGILMFLAVSALIDHAPAHNFVLTIIGILVLLELVLALRLIRLHRLIEKIDERVP